MAYKVILSSLGVDITEATITSILKKEGEEVKRGDAIATVETQKVSFEVVSPADGVVLKVLFNEGDVVKVGEAVAIVGAKGEDISALLEEIAKGLVKEEGMRKPIEKVKEGIPSAIALQRVKVYPAARKLAQELNLDLSEIAKSIPGEVITKEDVQKYFEEQGATKVIPLTGIRGTIAKRMVESVRTAAHVTTVIEVDMTPIKNLREEAKVKKNLKITYVPFVIEAAVRAIGDVPIVNSVIKEDKIFQKKDIHFGVAVGTEEGLLVPVIRHVEKMDLLEIARKLDEVASLAREKKLKPEDMQGGTITLSNGGAFGPIINTPILNMPQVALIWTGRITKRPVVVQDQIVIRDMMYLCLSYDHRAMDGRDAGTFVSRMKYYLEEAKFDL